jgi:hypothetical protein
MPPRDEGGKERFGKENVRKRQLQKHQWDSNIKMDFKQILWDGVKCIHLAQYRDER